MTSADFDIVVAACSQMIQERRIHVGEHGVAIATSWSPTDDVSGDKIANTIGVSSGKTAGNTQDDGDVGLTKHYINMASSVWGLQHAPRGGERVVLLPTETSPIGLILHGDDDSCATLKPGETILRHFDGEVAPDEQGNPGPGKVNSSLHFSNDGETAQDNLGAIIALAGGLLSVLTKAGYGFTVTDSSGAIVFTAKTIQVGNGSTTTIQVGGGGTKVQMGGSGATASNGIVRQSDLQTALSNFKAAMVAVNVTNAGGVVVPTVTGSATSFTA